MGNKEDWEGAKRILMKKIIVGIGIFFLTIVILLNILFTANLDNTEHITLNFNSITFIIGEIVVGTLIYIISEKINKKLGKTNNKSKIIFLVLISLYIIINIIWVVIVRPPIVGDQIHACNIAQTFYRNNLEEFLPNQTYAGIPLKDYMQAYHQQISLAFVFSLFFRVIHFDVIEILRVLNVIGNILIVIALYKINKQLSKKYETNRVLLFILIFTFFSLIMLNTFVYGDIPSLGLCLLSTYFMMIYTEKRKIQYSIWAAVFTSIAYMMRMNSLIFIIATVIYLLMNFIDEFKKKVWKERVINIIIIIMYILISIIPAGIVKNYYLEKYDMDKTKEYPNISYILMAMEESWRGSGWYNEDIGEPALKNPKEKKVEYEERVKNRIQYFIENPKEAITFYTNKLASMWTENTYSAIRNNTVTDKDNLEKINTPLGFYQKVLLIVMSICIIISIIQNRKNLSLEILFLITIFIGGFAFHILWEAKSRYIIPYIVILIPIASINIKYDNIKNKYFPRNKRKV